MRLASFVAALRTGLFNTPVKRLSITGGGGGGGGVNTSFDDEEDIFEVSGSNLNAARSRVQASKSKGGGRDRTTSSSSTGSKMEVRVRYAELEGLPEIYKMMRSADWKERTSGVEDVVKLVCNHTKKVVNSGKLLMMLDRLCEKLSDGNTKVNLLALQGVSRCLSALGERAEPSLGVLVPSLCGNLARSPKLHDLAKNIFEGMTLALDAKLLALPYCNAVLSNENLKVKSVMLRRLAEVVPRLCDEGNSSLCMKHIVPVATKNCMDSRNDIKAPCATLIVTLYSCLGQDFVNHVNRIAKEAEVNHIKRLCGF